MAYFLVEKWYIMKFLFILLLFLNIFCENFIINGMYIFISLKTSNALENTSQVFERSDCWITQLSLV